MQHNERRRGGQLFRLFALFAHFVYSVKAIKTALIRTDALAGETRLFAYGKNKKEKGNYETFYAPRDWRKARKRIS